eukprot:4905926-Pyramimonas_sp.AAC.1
MSTRCFVSCSVQPVLPPPFLSPPALKVSVPPGAPRVGLEGRLPTAPFVKLRVRTLSCISFVVTSSH